MSTSENNTTEKPYDEMSKPEQEEHDKVARAREQAEQDGEVKLKSQAEPILEGELFAEIKEEDSTWSIDDGVLYIELEKLSARTSTPQWWPHILTHHPRIDTSKLAPENSKLSDLDGETRGMVEKMMFDNQQKQMGKPTSDEQRKFEMLEKFKNAHPEMDFSNAKIG
ncbi:hypothetical protein QFC24_005259 [Naganishia onofrii]|uniref:Uncharacterized protein n=1 Tax=Naganishia onofrii TaxID=1851511 RepID=A0ACC2X9M1_9TREE|nr:hypothetical protein QFC24_005259 [Naganishia onofrii]